MGARLAVAVQVVGEPDGGRAVAPPGELVQGVEMGVIGRHPILHFLRAIVRGIIDEVSSGSDRGRIGGIGRRTGASCEDERQRAERLVLQSIDLVIDIADDAAQRSVEVLLDLH